MDCVKNILRRSKILYVLMQRECKLEELYQAIHGIKTGFVLGEDVLRCRWFTHGKMWYVLVSLIASYISININPIPPWGREGGVPAPIATFKNFLDI